MAVTPTPLSGTFYSASANAGATAPTTGSGVDLSGPWKIEKQELTIDYYRIPQRHSFDLQDINLSGAYDVSGSYQSQSVLFYKVTAAYSVVKSTDVFATSGHVQPQRFELNPDQYDVRGTEYGAVDASTMGPAGSIITSQPFYKRTLWDDNTDTEVNKTALGYNIAPYAPIKLDFVPFIGLRVYPAQSKPTGTIIGDMNLLGNELPNGPLEEETNLAFTGPNYPIWGDYATDKDNLNNILAFITNVGDHLRTTGQIPGQGSAPIQHFGGFFNEWSTMKVHDLSGIGVFSYEPLNNEYITEYDPARHEY